MSKEIYNEYILVYSNKKGGAKEFLFNVLAKENKDNVLQLYVNIHPTMILNNNLIYRAIDSEISMRGTRFVGAYVDKDVPADIFNGTILPSLVPDRSGNDPFIKYFTA